ncbi:prealbumin-like fold domain-containing protein [Microbacterium sp. A204]|uniref:prealbumin-like fold domain-containing protein n=1 Tax=Microbacterium sp. A204 TaxID=3457321 RepID=UPI003FD3E299
MKQIASGVAATAVLISGLVGGVSAAHAATVYEIEGQWGASTPAVVSQGDTVVSEWRFNMNDDAPAPENEIIPNATVTFTVANGVFTVLPTICLTDAALVDPVSSISADGQTMVCNLGDRAQGTAELVLAGIQVTGDTGDTVSITGNIGGVQAVTPELPIMNAFAMDMKWADGNPKSTEEGTYQMMGFPFSLRHAPGAEAGPSSVSYTVTINALHNEPVTARPLALGGPCTPITDPQSGYPYSGAAAGADTTNTAPFPTCTMTRIGTTNQYTVTVSGLDYSKALNPTMDSTGVALLTSWDVVASGMIWFRMTYVEPGLFTISANTPTYTSASGATSVDEAGNNANSRAYTRGVWSGGWQLNLQDPPVEGTIWTDTFEQMAGQPALAMSAVRPPQGTEPFTQTCTVLDTKYVTFDWAGAGSMSGGAVVPSSGPQPTIEYFTGTGANGVLSPTSPNYDPNSWECNAAGINPGNWSTTPPADLSTVKAVRTTIPVGAVADSAGVVRTFVQTTIKPDVAIGQDIYTWTSYLTSSWFHRHRSENTADAPDSGVILKPGDRHAYTGGGRDVLRVVGSTPRVIKEAGQAESIPGATVSYSLMYRAESPANVVLDEYTLVDTLPLGTTYEPGSATITPTSITTNVDGRVVLTWDLPDYVSTNWDYFMHYNVVLPDDAQPGQVFVNSATASTNGRTATDTARVRIREGGSTFITKTALQDTVPHVAGVANGGWTVRMTSEDTARQIFTDTIDVLPYIGDGRGSDFTGTYGLTGPIDISQMPAGTQVYYSVADPTTISDDPKDATNGAPNDVTGNTVGWSTTYAENATAVRVIGGELKPSASQEFTINVVTTGASYEDVYVNRAQGVTSRTDLVMRTSDLFNIAAWKSLVIKKYVQDAEGNWHDAQNIDDYPGFAQGADLNYRLVVTNTGDVALTDVQITDDKVDLAALSPLPAGLGAGAVIAEIQPGEANAVTIEYTVPLTGVAIGQSLINNACAAVPADAEVQESCDPAGVKALPSTLAWTKIAAGTTETLSGSEWELTPVDSSDAPTGAAVAIEDCVAATAAECTGVDKNHLAGEFLIGDLEAGRYMLIETLAPAGYVLGDTPHYIEVSGDTAFENPIENDQQPALVIPLTGGQSTDLYLLVGGALAVLIALLLVLRHRRRQHQLAV